MQIWLLFSKSKENFSDNIFESSLFSLMFDLDSALMFVLVLDGRRIRSGYSLVSLAMSVMYNG